MRPIRVAAILPLYPPRSRVGAWLATHSWLSGLVARGHQVRVATFLNRRGGRYWLDGVQVDPGAAAYAHALWGDVIVAHLGQRGSDGLAGLPLADGKPIVRIVHGAPAHPARMARCDLIVVNSETTRRAMEASGARQGRPIVVVRPATDPAEHRTRPGSEITCVNLSVEKGGDLFWRIAEAMPEERFLAVRGGYGRQLNADLPNVEIIGPNAHPMRDLVYARTRILLAPSRAETWGMVPVEAIASGIPVIARPLPAMRESLGAAATWVADDDPAAWVAEIERLRRPRQWRIASGRALTRSRELDWRMERLGFAEAIEELVCGS